MENKMIDSIDLDSFEVGQQFQVTLSCEVSKHLTYYTPRIMGYYSECVGDATISATLDNETFLLTMERKAEYARSGSRLIMLTSAPKIYAGCVNHQNKHSKTLELDFWCRDQGTDTVDIEYYEPSFESYRSRGGGHTQDGVTAVTTINLDALSTTFSEFRRV